MAFNQLFQNFEEGTNGTTLTTANTGNPSAPFDVISALASGQTLAFDNTHVALGSMALKLATGVTAATCYADWVSSFSWQAQTWFEIYGYFTANPSASMNVLTFQQSGSLCGRLKIGTLGKVVMVDSAGTTQITSSASVNLNSYFRIEGFLTGSATAGQVEFKLFNSPNSATPTETQTSGSALNTFGVPTTARWGLAQAVASTGPVWYDGMGLSNLGYIGALTAISDTDTGTGADGRETITLVSAESASGLDVAASIAFASSDSASFADTGAPNSPSSTEAGSFAEQAALLFNDADTSQAAENPSLVGVSDTETGSFADTGGFATLHAVSDTDAGTFTEALPKISFARGSGGGPGFPLIFQMASAAITPGADGDKGHFTEAQSIAVQVSSHDFGHFTETQNFPGGVPPAGALRVEGFSVTHAGVLLPGQSADAGTLYAVRSAQISPQWITTVSQHDDQVVNVWNAPGTVQVTIQGGFFPWDVLAALAGTTVSSSGAAPADYYALPLFRQHVTGQLPLLLRASGKDALGNQRTVQFVAYAAQFGPVSFGGPAYKNGLTATYTASLLLSAQDETGLPLPDRAYGRLLSMPAGATGWNPGTPAPVQVADTDSGTFFDTGTASQVGGSTFVSDTDSGHFTEGQRVSTGTVNISDADSGHFTETREVAGPVVFVSDTDHFTTRPRAGLVGATTPQGEYGPPTNRLDSATQFDSLVGRNMATSGVQKIYYQQGQFPTSYTSLYTGIVSAGCFIWLCYQPAIDGSDASALAASIAALKAATPGGRVKVVLWQEPQNFTSLFNAAQFVSLMQAYYPVVHAQGVPLVYDSATHAGVTGVTSYFPVVNGTAYCDEGVCDYYCSTFVNLDASNGATPLALEALCRKYGQMPFGFGELGTALSQTEANNVTKAQFTAYINFIINLMVGRLATGQFNSECAWYNGDNTGAPTWNTITSSSDYRVPLLQQLNDTLSRQKVAGALEGGGETPVAKISSNGTRQGGYMGGRVAQLIGAISSPATTCPSSVSDWLTHGNPTIGPLDTDKLFYSGTQVMDTFQNGHLGSDNESQLPAGVVPFVTFKDSQIPTLAQYVASIPDDRLVYMSYWQEAEDSYPGGNFATFIATFIQCSQIIRSVGKANVKVFQNSAGSKYGISGSTAQQGFWQVPPEHVDAYTVDTYQRANLKSYPSQGLSNYPEWLNWLSVYAGSGRQLGITEYGISNATAGQRSARLQLDCAYLRSAFPPSAPSSTQVSPLPLLLWEYWWSNCQAGAIGPFANQFTDSGTITTWQQIGSGAL